MTSAQLLARELRKEDSEENAVAGCQAEAHPKLPHTPHTVNSGSRASRWGVILAGGDGTRLRPLTHLICGDDRPKQFCPLTGDETLFEQTRLRAEQTIPAEHLLVPLTIGHKAYYCEELGIRPRQRIVQPSNKGTAPPIIYSLLSIVQRDPDALVAVLPCDHYFADERGFSTALESAFEVAAGRNQSVVLLGAPAQGPEQEFGWIEVRASSDGCMPGVFGVQRFFEKPPARVALELFRRGALWNTFVMVAKVSAFLSMASYSLPDLVEALRQSQLWTGSEVQIEESVYRELSSADFSREVLSVQPERLLVLQMEDGGWSDLGRPDRVMAVLRDAGLQPWWMKTQFAQQTRRLPRIDAVDQPREREEVAYGAN